MNLLRLEIAHKELQIALKARDEPKNYANSKLKTRSKIPDIYVILILISKHKIVKLKLTLTLSMTLTDTGGAVLTLMLGARSFIHYIGTPQKSLHRVTIRNDSFGLVGRRGPNRRSKSTIKLFDK